MSSKQMYTPLKQNFFLGFLCLCIFTLVYGQAAKRPTVGLVLSGGGAKGIAHVGTLKVLEELNIPIDYISGTSMGAIIGGMYAAGYTAKELDSLLRHMNWSELLSDQVSRPNLSMLEKVNDVRYPLKLSYGDGQGIIPMGAIKGQNIDNTFYSLTNFTYKLSSFKDLNIPYLCIATDIVQGKAIILEKGNLAQAMRASMAVPSVFAPVILDSAVLVDGGVVDNFPVEVLKERGIDIIIGVDVGFNNKSSKDMKSLVSIIEQTAFLSSKEKLKGSIEKCDIYIKPNLIGYTSASFGSAPDLLDIGDSAAKAAYPELKALADRLKTYPPDPPKTKMSHTPLRKVYLDSIRYFGLEKYTPLYANKYLQLNSNAVFDLKDLDNSISRLYGTQVFSKVTYQLIPSEKKQDDSLSRIILAIHCEEAPSNLLEAGIAYDIDRGATLMIGTVFRNLLAKNSRLSIDLELSRMPFLDVAYNFTPRWKKNVSVYSLWVPSINIRYRFYNLYAFVYGRDDNMQDRRTQELTAIGNLADISFQFNQRNDVFGIGLGIDHCTLNSRIGADSGKGTNFNWYPYFVYKRDSYNKKYFATRGVRLDVNIKFVNNMYAPNLLESSFFSAYMKASWAIPIHKRWTFYPGFTVASTLFRTTHDIPYQYTFTQGGLANPELWYTFDFVGLQFMQSAGFHLWNAHANLQYTPLKNFYIGARMAVGQSEFLYEDFLDTKDLLIGAGLTVSYLTPIGPACFTLQGANKKGVSAFISLGYSF